MWMADPDELTRACWLRLRLEFWRCTAAALASAVGGSTVAADFAVPFV